MLCGGFDTLCELVDLVLDPIHRDVRVKLEVLAAARKAHEAFVCPLADGQVDRDGLSAGGVLDLVCLEGQAASASKAGEERRGDDHQEERVGDQPDHFGCYARRVCFMWCRERCKDDAPNELTQRRANLMDWSASSAGGWIICRGRCEVAEV